MPNILAEITALSWPRTLQAAAVVFSYHNGTSLAPAGCYLDGYLGSDRNCTLACQNLANVFGSADTFHNCLSYPTIRQILSSNDTSPADEELADTYGILRNAGAASPDIVGNFAKCLMGYCSSSKTCMQIFNHSSISIAANSTTFPIARQGYYTAFYNDNLDGTLGTITGICEAIRQTSAVNADISGIGIYVAYFMQAGISLIAWLLLRLWGSGLYFGCLAYGLYHYDYPKAYEWAEATRHRWTHQRDKITEGLIEFHKAQCFFMLAIQAASLIAKRGNLLDRSSLQQIHNDNTFIDVLSIGGHLPIIFVLHTLRTTGHKSRYLFVLSVCTVSLSAAAHFTIRSPLPTVASNGYQYPDCGGINPTALCLETDFVLPPLGNAPIPIYYPWISAILNSSSVGGSHFNTVTASLLFSLIVVVILLLDYWDAWLPTTWSPLEEHVTLKLKDKFSHALASTVKQLSAALTHKARLFCSGLPSLIVSISYFAFFFYYLIDLNYFQLPTQGAGSDYIPIDLSQWTFGQIAAVTIWIQPLFQYLYVEIRGLQGRRWHLPRDYEVVLVKEHKVPLRRRSTTW